MKTEIGNGHRQFIVRDGGGACTHLGVMGPTNGRLSVSYQTGGRVGVLRCGALVLLPSSCRDVLGLENSVVVTSEALGSHHSPGYVVRIRDDCELV